VILAGKKIVVTGVVNRHSIGFAIAERAQAEGAEVVLTSFGRVKRMTERSAARLDPAPEVLDLDVNSDEDIAALRGELETRWGRVDGAVHAIAFAPGDAIGGEFMKTPRESAKLAFETSAYSYKALAEALAPLMEEGGGSFVGLDFDATVAWPSYDWMGVAKAALESVSRYLARDLGPRGIRVNLVSAGPIRTAAASGVPGFAELESAWGERAPLGWQVDDPAPVADAALFLLSDLARAIAGEIVHVDGGFHAIGAAVPSSESGAAAGEGRVTPPKTRSPAARF
jgi:enoyl-[acyl-carrier protein] reductase I